MSIFLDADSRVIVQGITGGEGTKHTALMLKAGTTIVGGVNARKAGTTVTHGDLELPVFGTVAEAVERDRRERLGRLRAGGLHARTPWSSPSTRRSRCWW